MAEYIRDPRAYELMVMIVPDITDEEIAEELTRVQGFLSDIGSELKEVLTDSPWGRRRLAYSIRFNNIDYRDGFYAVIHFSARPDSLFDLERELKLDTRVIRYLLVHDDPKAGVREPNNPERATGDAEAPATSSRPSAPAAPAAAAPAAEASGETTDAASEAVAATETAASTTEAPATETAETVASATEAPAENVAPADETAPEAPATEDAPAAEAPASEETADEPTAVGVATAPAEDVAADSSEEE